MTDPIVVGVLYPGEWNLDFDRHLAELAAIDPRIEIVVEPYEESRELRSGRGVPPYDAVRHLAPSLTAAQRRAFARIECCLTLDLPFDVAAAAPRLRWVQALAAGVAHLTSAGLREAGIRLTNASGANATSIAEFVFARILGEFKRTRRLDTIQQQRRWHPVFGQNLAGSTIGLVGFGPINQAVARRARAFELDVIVVRRSAAGSDLADEVLGPDGLHDMLGRCDIVVAAVPESPETHELFDSSAFAAMQDGSMFVNVGRGSLVDEPALVAHLTSAGLREAGIRLTNASGANATSIAEFVFARILGEFKRTRRLDTIQQQRRWHPVFGQNLAGSTIGLVGFGPINQAVARRARAFELDVIVVRRSAAGSDLADEVLGPDGLHDMLGRCDIVVAAVPESPETHELFDSSAFAAMQDGSMFVNVGRGSLVDEPALVAALRSDKLRAAALDVTAVEPLPEDSPLWDAPNIYISAHCSTEPTRFFESAHRVFADNLARYVAGEPLLNEILLAEAPQA
ncbi:MAG: hypothetical protein OXH43_06635 [Acidimicrobiaceae bacterium]|nr:hypothetical protein [Acidimicrobiaceae bacterium]